MIEYRPHSTAFVSDFEMNAVYEKIKTPNKIGPVVKWDSSFTDSPTVFLHDGCYYMYFIAISKDISVSGYETHLAVSRDLTKWEYIGPVLRRNEEGHWDSKQCAGYAAFTDVDFNGGCRLNKVNGKYFVSYLAGNSDGYEPDPLYMGLASAADPADYRSYSRMKDPILLPGAPDARPYETKTLYKSCMFIDPLKTTGYDYVNVYNAKGQDDKERIFLAVSEDGIRWERYGNRACLDLVSEDSESLITGDPQILLIDDIYVMLFFRYCRNRPAFNTFACSRDLENWKVWEGDPLIKSEYEWEQTHAHKSWLVHANNRNYHFYCAVNDAANERFIALATSD